MSSARRFRWMLAAVGAIALAAPAPAEAGRVVGFADSALGDFLGLEAGGTERYVMRDGAGKTIATVNGRVRAITLDPTGRMSRAELTTETREADGNVTNDMGIVTALNGRLSIEWETGKFDILLVTPLKPGTTWRYQNGYEETRATIVAVEDVCTPAGRFENTLKVVAEQLVSGEVVRYEYWFARGFGEVQSTVSFTGAAPLKMHLAERTYPRTKRLFAPLACE